MSRDKKHIDKTSAESKSIGFDFQYYFFLSKLLELKTGQSVGLEVKDDVHTDLEDDIQVFYQVKHTVKTQADNSPSNLTTSDSDLWKTFSNWTKVISDENDNRSTVKSHNDFVQKSHFVLFTNKSSNPNNELINTLESFQIQVKNITEVIAFLTNYKEESGDATIQSYVDDILELDKSTLQLFFERVHFELDENDIISKCKDGIKEKMIPDGKVDDVFAKIDSKLREDNFIDIRSGIKIQLSFEEFHSKYGLLFNVARDGSRQIKENNLALPDKFEEQIFIKQLLDIGDISEGDVELMAEYTRFKLKLITNLNDWYNQGEITRDELNAFDAEALANWKNKFRRTFRDGDFSEEKSRDLVDDLREVVFKVGEQGLGTELSNGQFYKLSDEPKIGWTKDWENYKESE